MNTIGVSVIICCYNSASRIEKTLGHILLQQFTDNIEWELILVDNNSSDNTVDISHHILSQSNLSYKIVSQPLPGLSHARKKGVQQAQYSYLVFCDDDNWLNPNYVQNVHHCFYHHSEYHILGGHGFAVADTQLPTWFTQYQYCYAVGDQSEYGPIKKTVYGAGSAFRIECFERLEKLGFENVITGRIGTKMLSGEDTEICWMLHLLGFHLHVPNKGLEFKHYIPVNRLHYTHLKKFHYWNGFSSFYISSYEDIFLNNLDFVNVYPLWFLKRILYQMKILVKILVSPESRINLCHWRGYCYSLLRNGKSVNKHIKSILNLLKK